MMYPVYYAGMMQRTHEAELTVTMVPMTVTARQPSLEWKLLAPTLCLVPTAGSFSPMRKTAAGAVTRPMAVVFLYPTG